MPRRRPAKNWSAATLKSRGWTNALIRELLPPPEYEVTESGRRRIWNKKLVKAAEEHPHFQARKIEPRKTPAQGAGNACKLLSQAWPHFWVMAPTCLPAVTHNASLPGLLG